MGEWTKIHVILKEVKEVKKNKEETERRLRRLGVVEYQLRAHKNLQYSWMGRGLRVIYLGIDRGCDVSQVGLHGQNKLKNTHLYNAQQTMIFL